MNALQGITLRADRETVAESNVRPLVRACIAEGRSEYASRTDHSLGVCRCAGLAK